MQFFLRKRKNYAEAVRLVVKFIINDCNESIIYITEHLRNYGSRFSIANIINISTICASFYECKAFCGIPRTTAFNRFIFSCIIPQQRWIVLMLIKQSLSPVADKVY